VSNYRQIIINSGELCDSDMYLSAELTIQLRDDTTIDENKIKDLLTDLLYDVLGTMD